MLRLTEPVVQDVPLTREAFDGALAAARAAGLAVSGKTVEGSGRLRFPPGARVYAAAFTG